VFCVVCPDVDIVIIHDAVRPLVDEECVMAVANAASEHGVSISGSVLFHLHTVVCDVTHVRKEGNITILL